MKSNERKKRTRKREREERAKVSDYDGKYIHLNQQIENGLFAKDRKKCVSALFIELLKLINSGLL